MAKEPCCSPEFSTKIRAGKQKERRCPRDAHEKQPAPLLISLPRQSRNWPMAKSLKTVKNGCNFIGPMPGLQQQPIGCQFSVTTRTHFWQLLGQPTTANLAYVHKTLSPVSLLKRLLLIFCLSNFLRPVFPLWQSSKNALEYCYD